MLCFPSPSTVPECLQSLQSPSSRAPEPCHPARPRKGGQSYQDSFILLSGMTHWRPYHLDSPRVEYETGFLCLQGGQAAKGNCHHKIRNSPE